MLREMEDRQDRLSHEGSDDLKVEFVGDGSCFSFQIRLALMGCENS
jgi:hypothetical protein